MELPNTHAHTYGDIHTHTHTQKQKGKKGKKMDNQQTTVTHLGENKRLRLENSKQNCYIIL